MTYEQWRVTFQDSEQAALSAFKYGRQLERRVKDLEDRLFAMGAMNDYSCFRCGYNGKDYYNPSVHPCAERHHKLFQEEQNQ